MRKQTDGHGKKEPILEKRAGPSEERADLETKSNMETKANMETKLKSP
jgi:hypothetical protein